MKSSVFSKLTLVPSARRRFLHTQVSVLLVGTLCLWALATQTGNISWKLDVPLYTAQIVAMVAGLVVLAMAARLPSANRISSRVLASGLGILTLAMLVLS